MRQDMMMVMMKVTVMMKVEVVEVRGAVGVMLTVRRPPQRRSAL